MKYKVGDKVRVRNNLCAGSKYPYGEEGCYFTDDMSKFLGKEVYITYVDFFNERYAIENSARSWSDEMLEDVEEYVKEEVKFEKGKWYKGEPNNFYFKAAGGVEQSESWYNLVPVTEEIICRKHEVISRYWSNDKYEKFALENPVDLSEIQQYLPEGHPDKINTLEQSRESLLAEAKKRYPVGTRFKSASNGKIYVVHKRHEVSLFISSCGDWVLVDIDDIGKMEHVYYDEKWAEIVESPTIQQKITPNNLNPIGVDPISFESSKNKGEYKSPTNESDFPIISTKRIINFSQLT